ncbi:MAG: hypothetical protein ACMXYM_03295 [Candidatus Woesearchaeota archaeon]
MVDSDKKDISDIMYEYQSSQDKLIEELRFFVIIEKPCVTGI